MPDSDQARAENAARKALAAAMNNLRTGQTILQWAGWQHDPFAAAIDEVKNTYLSLQDYTQSPLPKAFLEAETAC